MSRRSSSSVLIGRETELGALASALERASGGVPELVLVAGDAGVGKSRLTAEFVTRAAADGVAVIQGSCLDLHDDGLPYAPFVEAFRNLNRRADLAVAAIDTDHAEAIASLLGPRADGLPDARSPDVRLVRLFDAVLAILGRLAADRPVILVLEDIHWADASTRDLIRFLVRNVSDERLLLVATYRTDELYRRHPVSPLLVELLRADRVSRLDLHPLGHDEVRDLVASILGESPAPALVDLLTERSDGLPFYIEELVAAGPGSARLPTTLRDILGRRIDVLPPVARSLLGAAAVIGRRTSEEALAIVTGLAEDDLIEAIRAATEAGVLVASDEGPDPSYGFRHALLREAAADQLVPPERARLHARTADHLERTIAAKGEDPGLVADLAGHAFAAHDQPRALLWSVRAARVLIATVAFDEALVHAERALSLWPQVADPMAIVGIDRLELRELAATAANGSNRHERAVAHLTDALEELDRRGNVDPEREAALLLELWSSAWEAYDHDRVGTTIARAVTLVDRVPPPARLGIAIASGSDLWWTGSLRESARVLEDAVAMAEAAGDVAGWGEAMTNLAHTRADLGQADVASDLIDRSADAIRAGGPGFRHVMTWGDRSVTLLTVGRFADSEAAALEGLEVARRYGWEERVAHYLRACLVDACFELGRLGEVDAIAAPVLAGFGVPHSIEWMRTSVARVEARRGDLVAARQMLDGIEDDDQWGVGSYLMLAHVDIARAAGDLDEVLSLVDRVAEATDQEAVAPVWQILGLGIEAAGVAAESGRRRRRTSAAKSAAAAASSWLDALRRIVARARTEGGAGAWMEAALEMAETEVRRMSGAVDPEDWAAVVERWDALPHPHSAATARYRMADALLRRGHRSAAEAALRQAAAQANAAGSRPLAVAIASLAEAGRIRLTVEEPLEGRTVRERSVIALTPRERAVLGLVAEGHTNREIGDRLFISEKTVSVHVTNAMAKLGALSRYEAAGIAERQGLLEPPPS